MAEAPVGLFAKVNAAVENSVVGRYFELAKRGSNFTTEIRAGLVTFLTMAYILAVNANILTDSGGPCSSADCTGPDKSFSCRFYDPGYEACLAKTKTSLITATAASSLIACILMGAGANLPIGLAPGMGVNAYFTYTVVGFRGTGRVAYKEALAAIFIESIIFMVLGVTGLRAKVITWLPKNIMLATSAGIGMFLAFIGLQASEGIGLIDYDSATLVSLGGCKPEFRAHMYTISDPDPAKMCTVVNGTATKVDLGPKSNAYQCLHNEMRSATLWLGIFGGLLMVLLMARKVKGAIMLGILFITVISWIPTKSNEAAFLGKHSQIPGGKARLEYFKKVVTAPDASKTAGALDFGAFSKAELWVALVTFLYVDFLDTTGTLYSMANFLDLSMPGFINEKTREFPKMIIAYTVDGFAILIGSLLGTSPVTAYIESASGIKEGGRTGITAIVVGLCFFVALFFTPILASIPPYATGPALIFVGALMMENVLKIEWHVPHKALPAFLTMAIMPLTYSVAYGVIAGICSAIFLEGGMYLLDLVSKKKSTEPEVPALETAKTVE